MPGLGVDISNYTGSITGEQVACLRERDIVFVVIGLQDWEVAMSQEKTAKRGGLQTQRYATRPQQIVGRDFIWLDVEEGCITSSSELRLAAELCESQGVPWGIYASASSWARYMGDNIDFKSQPLWWAHYDGIPDLVAGWEPFGGWEKPTVKQYRGTTVVCGVSVDLNVR